MYYRIQLRGVWRSLGGASEAEALAEATSLAKLHGCRVYLHRVADLRLEEQHAHVDETGQVDRFDPYAAERARAAQAKTVGRRMLEAVGLAAPRKELERVEPAAPVVAERAPVENTAAAAEAARDKQIADLNAEVTKSRQTLELLELTEATRRTLNKLGMAETEVK